MRDCCSVLPFKKGESSVLKYITEQLPAVKEIKLMGEFETFGCALEASRAFKMVNFHV